MSTGHKPVIESVRWGEIILGGGQRFKDVKLYPGGAREWDWNETGTRHSPGIRMEDVQELLDHGAKVVILARGQLGRLEVAPATVQALKSLNIEVHVLKTEDAVELYNRLSKEQAVGALIHSTC